MARHQRDPAKEASWRGVFKRFASSGVSVREFCRREQLTESAFYAWRRTISERDDIRSPGPVFVPAIVTPSPSEPSLALEFPGGCVLRFAGPRAAEHLADLILALQTRSAR